MRRRIAATRWPSQANWSQTIRGYAVGDEPALAQYWANGYDWRTIEARFNATPQFLTAIDGVDIHFIHVRSKHDNALPLIITHGWPGSIIEQLKVIGPLTDPTAHGGERFGCVSCGDSVNSGVRLFGRTGSLGWDPVRVAKAWILLMKRLGYHQICRARRRLGRSITQQMALLEPDHGAGDPQ